MIVRRIVRSPGSSILVVITLGLAIAVTTTVASAVRGVLLAPLPYPDAERVTAVLERMADGEGGTTGFATFADWRQSLRSFSSMCAVATRELVLAGDGGSQRLDALGITPGTFSTFGLHPILGRDFTAADDVRSGPRRVILGYELWRNRFDGEPGVIGRVVRMSDIDFEVVGVMPPKTRLTEEEWRGRKIDAWIPLRYTVELPWACRDCRHIRVFGRLKSGVSIDAANREVAVFTDGLRRQFPNQYSAQGSTSVEPLRGRILGPATRPALWVVLGVALLVLLIAASNAAGVRLAELIAREGEIATRLALGATPLRIAAMLAVEGTVQAAAACAVGIPLARWSIELLRNRSQEFLPRAADLSLDWRMVLVAIGIALATGLLSSFVPALRIRRLTVGGAGQRVTDSGARTQALLAGINIALSMVLLVGGGLLLRSVSRLFATDPGFRPEGVVSFHVAVSGEGYDDPSRLRDLYARLTAASSGTPGVLGFALTTQLPFDERNDGASMHDRDRPDQKESEAPMAQRFAVTPGYFSTLGIPIRRGRAFGPQDTASGEPVVILNETAARVLWPEGEPLGRRVRVAGGEDNPYRLVVGVVGDVAHGDLGGPASPQAYLPLDQFGGDSLIAVARAGGNLQAEAALLRDAAHAVEPGLAIYSVRTMKSLVAASESRRTFLLALLSAFGIAGLILAVVGVYGVVSFTVGRKKRELGVRSALGATGRRLFGFVLGYALRVVAAAIIPGLLLSIAAGRLLRAFLFGVSGVDPITIAGVAALLLVTALGASAVPAIRAARLSPTESLRQE